MSNSSNVIQFKRILHRILVLCIIDMGLITLLCLGGLFLKPSLMPIFSFLLLLPILIYGNNSIAQNKVNCSLINHYTIYALFATGVLMLFLNMDWVHWIKLIIAKPNGDIEYVSTLIVYPVAAISFGLALFRRGKPEYCYACKEQACHSVKESIERNLFHKETRVLLVAMCAVCVFLTIVSWGYYFLFFINVNFNSPDIFFFFITPVAVYVLLIISIMMRYSNLEFKFTMLQNRLESPNLTHLRYWVIKDGQMLLQVIGVDNTGVELWDTSAIAEDGYTECVTEKTAKEIFEKISGAEGFAIKYLFKTNTENSNSFHYAIVFESAEAPTPKLEGRLFNLYQVNKMMHEGRLVKPLVYELHRVFKITMAWKTYDEEGRRRYPIKKYRPAFRLKDIMDWTVDYDDLSWMSVSKNNEDTPFYKLRKFLRYYVSAVDMRWKSKRS